ncbi:MAG: hypothetical protein CL608_31010 [Anaerolineaceae bacterium]|nr:hypothetical protein [Anaerolineaceae bacterium]
MNKNVRTIVDTCGRFTLRENGIIYFHRADNVVMDAPTALKCLEHFRELDNSGNARLIIIQGHGVEYTFDAKMTLLNSKLFKAVALVANSDTQYLVGTLFQDLAKAFRAKHQLRVFHHMEDAEKWLLSFEQTAVPDPNNIVGNNPFIPSGKFHESYV